MQTFPMTKEGHATLKEELRYMKGTERPSIVAQIAEAREHGDLSENAEYHAAKEKQGFIEARIGELETKLSYAKIIDVATLSGERVVFGATVTVLDLKTDEEQTYTIVGADQASAHENKYVIASVSPIARALISKSEGDEVQIRTPAGLKELEILKVTYAVL
ncbi:MAG: transcription elongation factor GreA [Deltaproteobacteria bacterium]|nr:transcription elongation factor GreA [Deltaproteobacteria bacterium]